MAYASVDVTVDVDLDYFSDVDLITELKNRGYNIAGECACDDEKSVQKKIHQLRTTYLTMSPEFFEKELNKFFEDNQ